MERIPALFCLMCIVWICIVEVTTRNDDDRELLQELIDALASPNINSDARNSLSKKGTTRDIQKNGNDVRKGFSHRYNDDKLTGSEIDDEIRALLNEMEADERAQARMIWAHGDIIIRGTDTTASPKSSTGPPPQTNPPTTTAATTTAGTTTTAKSKPCYGWWFYRCQRRNTRFRFRF
ncbi:uncharacterized protein LOC123547299 [Mercenaria mercenaria]|uniref:uncharacterized protein LOC123547299 n=1 Tax=Mercenaria mercenaria TaxID=6596 RepID=UPI00234F1B73|nr:uncharacterized protein LOC123547299 [Mercenaria mercenaria]